jgi:Abortive infection alpha
MIDPKLASEAVVLFAALKSDAGKKLLGPLAEQFGLALGDLGQIFRFYQRDNLDKIFTKWAASRDDKPPLNEHDFQKIIPLLQLASLQSDEELQTRWAALLENTVTTTDGILPSFGQTLSQLTSEEARFLDRLFAFVSQPKGYLSQHHPGREPLEYVSLVNIFDPSIAPGIGPAEREFFKDKLSEQQLKNYDRLTQGELVIQDLERLGILNQTQRAEADRYMVAGTGDIPFERSTTHLWTGYSFTQYGVSFVHAITQPRKSGEAFIPARP